MPTIDTLDALLKHELKDLYSAETQIIEALPIMIEAASNDELKNALQQHLEVTKEQKLRLEEIQKLLGEENAVPEKKGFFANLFSSSEGEEHCKAMEGLVKEGNELLQEDMSPEVMDAAIIAASQKIEHYEISSYGTARAYALQLKLDKVASLLSETLNEEYFADDNLTALALSNVNIEAGTKQATSRNKSAKKAKAAKKASPKKTAPKKAASKKAPAKKASPKKQPPKKAKSAAAKKSTTSKATGKRR